jgi:hypothetical protein
MGKLGDEARKAAAHSAERTARAGCGAVLAGLAVLVVVLVVAL